MSSQCLSDAHARVFRQMRVCPFVSVHVWQPDLAVLVHVCLLHTPAAQLNGWRLHRCKFRAAVICYCSAIVTLGIMLFAEYEGFQRVFILWSCCLLHVWWMNAVQKATAVPAGLYV
jgi:hypothetical protein